MREDDKDKDEGGDESPVPDPEQSNGDAEDVPEAD
jgi:hypothetical protein